MPTLYVKIPKDQSPDGQEKVQVFRFGEKPDPKLTKEARADIRRLRQLKREFRDNTLSKNDLKTKLGLTKEEINQIEPTSKFGLTRYKKENIHRRLLKLLKEKRIKL